MTATSKENDGYFKDIAVKFYVCTFKMSFPINSSTSRMHQWIKLILCCFSSLKNFLENVDAPVMLFKRFIVYDNSIMFVSACIVSFLCVSSTVAAKVPRAHQAFWSGSVLRWRKVTRRQCFSCSCLLFTSLSVTTVRCEKWFLLLSNSL